MGKTLNIEKLQPVGSRLLVRKDEITQTQGGILLPKGASGECLIGEVLEVGDGRWSEQQDKFLGSDFKPGDYIYYFAHGSTPIHRLLSGGRDDLFSVDETYVQGRVVEKE